MDSRLPAGVAALAMLVSIAACQEACATPSPTKDPARSATTHATWREFHDPRYGVSLRYPPHYVPLKDRDEPEPARKLVLMDRGDFEEFRRMRQAGEATDGAMKISFRIGRGMLGETLQQYVQRELGGAAAETRVTSFSFRGTDAVSYESDGLWLGYHVVIERPNLRLHASVTFNDRESKIRKDFDSILATLSFAAQEPAQNESHTTRRGSADVIRVFRPRRGATVASPMIVRGEARGPWYFEANFPVRVLDANGTVLVETYAQARGEWMTEAYVPFEVELRLAFKPGEQGSLVLAKANASGLPEHDDELVVPLLFQASLVDEPD